LLLVVALPCVSAYKAGILVDSGSSLESDCVDVPEGSTAKDVLEKSGFSATYSYGGRFLDSINGQYNDFGNSRSWWFYYNEGDDTKLAEVGITDYKLWHNNSFVYFGYYNYDESFQPEASPEQVSFYDACPSMANWLVLSDIYIDIGESNYRAVNNSVIFVNPGTKLVLFVKLKNELYASQVDEKAATIEGVVRFALGDELLEEDFMLEPDESDTLTFEFILPYTEPGFYKGSVNIDGYDEYARKHRLLLKKSRTMQMNQHPSPPGLWPLQWRHHQLIQRRALSLHSP